MKSNPDPRPTNVDLADWEPRVRELARRLVRDPNLAEDILQEVYLLAMERPPRSARRGSGLWAWLRAVTRTVARQHFRSERRRKRREHAVARPEGTVGLFDDLCGAECARRVGRTVDGLPAPYGDTLRLRLFEGLEPREIARIQGVAGPAVRMRLTRGLRMLQERLAEARPGDGSRDGRGELWAGFLGLPSLGRVLGGRTPASPTHPRAWAALAVPVFAALALLLTPVAGGRDMTGDRSPVGAQGDLGSAVLGVEAPTHWGRPRPGSVRRAASPEFQKAIGEESEAIRAPADSSTPDRRGHAFWADGRPVRGIELEVVGVDCESCSRGGACPSHRLRTDEFGAFGLPPVAPSGVLAWVRSCDPGAVTVLAGAVTEEWGSEPLAVVLDRGARLDGHVGDSNGLPVSRAPIRWSPSEGVRVPCGVALGLSRPLSAETRTDEAGRFSFERIPRNVPGVLEVERPGLDPIEIPIDPGPTVSVVVEAPSVDSSTASEASVEVPSILRGRVVDGRGRPLAGAYVLHGTLCHGFRRDGEVWSSEGARSTPPAPFPDPWRSDDQGRFQLENPKKIRATNSTEVWVVDPSSLLSRRVALDRGGAELTFVLDRDADCLDVAGSVRGPGGDPVRDARVWALTSTTSILEAGVVSRRRQVMRQPVAVDAEGRFRIEGVSAGAEIHIEAPGRSPQRLAVAPLVEVVLPRLRNLHLVDAPRSVATAGFLDHERRPIPADLRLVEALGRVPFVGGSTGVLRIPETATWVRYFDLRGVVLGESRLELAVGAGGIEQIPVGFTH